MLSNRHHILTLWQAFLALCLLTSCAGDKLENGQTASKNPISGDSPHYLSIKLKSPDGTSLTRASSSFTNGDENEHKVGDNGHSVIFFDKENNLLSVSPLLLLGHTDHKEGDNKEATYSARVYPKDSEWPTSCLVVLNGSTEIEELLNKFKDSNVSVDEFIKEMIWSADKEKTGKNPRTIGFSSDNKEFFTMTNSMYFNDGVKQWPVKIPNNAIAESQEEAEEKAMTVYVERMVAKCSLSANPDGNGKYLYPSNAPLLFFNGFSDDGYIEYAEAKEWRAEVTGWGINALETKSHIFKNINKEGNYFGNREDWNTPSDFRSYWSEDPHYNSIEDKYPWQYRWAVEKELDYYEQGNSPLRNFSYNDFVNEGFDKVVYVPENTYGQNVIEEDLDSRTNLLAGTHLIICAELQIKEGDTWITDNWYRDRTGIFYKSEQDCFVAFAHALNRTLESQETMDFTAYDWENGGIYKGEKDVTAKTANSENMRFMLYYKEDPLTDEYLKDIMKMSRDDFAATFGLMKDATIQHGDGKRLPWFEDENGELLLTIKPYFENSDANEEDTDSDETNSENPNPEEVSLKIWTRDIIEEAGEGEPGYTRKPGKELRKADTNDVKSLLYDWLGAVDHFNKGKMYYAAPILHNGANHSTSAKQTVLGDYGVVRNCWYDFNLKKINAMGIPVAKPDQPIVPDRIGINDIINVTVRIIDWHPITSNVPIL